MRDVVPEAMRVR